MACSIESPAGHFCQTVSGNADSDRAIAPEAMVAVADELFLESSDTTAVISFTYRF